MSAVPTGIMRQVVTHLFLYSEERCASQRAAPGSPAWPTVEAGGAAPGADKAGAPGEDEAGAPGAGATAASAAACCTAAASGLG